MDPKRKSGVVIIAFGAFLLALGYHAANTPIEVNGNSLTGRFIVDAALFLASGIVAFIVGNRLAYPPAAPRLSSPPTQSKRNRQHG